MVRKKRGDIKKDRQQYNGPSGISIIIITVILAGVPFVLGKYIELNSPGPFDSGAYVYSAKHLLEGAKLGVEEKASAKPGTLLVNVIGVAIFGFNDTGPKIIQGLMQLGALALMFYAMRKVFGSLAAIIAVTIASAYLSAPVIAKFGNVKEQYMIACMIITASCLMLRLIGGKWFWQIFAGAAAVNIYYFKITGISIIIAILVYMTWQVVIRNWKLKQFGVELTFLFTGAIIGLVPLWLFLLWQNELLLLNKSVPAALTGFAAVLIIIGFVIHYTAILSKRYHLIGQLRTVRPAIWVCGGISIAVVLLTCSVYFAFQGEFSYFAWDVFFIKYPLKLAYKADAVLTSLITLAESSRGYVGISRKVVGFSKQMPVVMGYYKALILPIALSFLAIIARIIRLTIPRVRNAGSVQDSTVLLLGVWWVLDMAFVWISPRPYEEYYLPLCGSAAVLGGYLIWLYSENFKASLHKPRLAGLGVLAVICMVMMSQHIFLGLKKSPYSGQAYTDQQGQSERRRGYAQQLKSVAVRKDQGQIGMWELAGDYIRQHSTGDDTIYVWGWYPGIYVKAQRFSTVRQAFESDMHVKSAQVLSAQIEIMVGNLSRNRPKFIVDTRKMHFPNDRPPLELWPITKRGPLPNDEKAIEAFDTMYEKMLAEVIEPAEVSRYRELTLWDWTEPWKKTMPDEAQRYRAMKPFRSFLMKDYRIVKLFGQHVLFERKDEQPGGDVK